MLDARIRTTNKYARLLALTMRNVRMARVMALGLMPLLLVGAFSLPVFAKPTTSTTSTACSNFFQSQGLASEVFWAGYCASPTGQGSTISGGTLDFTVPSVSCSYGTCNGFFIGLLGVPANVGAPGASPVPALVRINQDGNSTCVGSDTPNSDAGLCGPGVHAGDRIRLQITSIAGGFKDQVNDLTTGVSFSGTLTESYPLGFLFFGMTTVCGACQVNPLLWFGSMRFTQAMMEVGSHPVPLSRTDLFPMVMHGATIINNEPVVLGVVAQPTAVRGSSFTVVQSNPGTTTVSGA